MLLRGEFVFFILFSMVYSFGNVSEIILYRISGDYEKSVIVG